APAVAGDAKPAAAVASAAPAAGAIPGLPSTSSAARPAAPSATPAVPTAPAARPTTQAAAETPRLAPAQRLPDPRTAPLPAPSETALSRAAPQVHPRVDAGYNAYLAGDLAG